MGRDYTKIKAWQLADELALLVYKATKKFPKSEVWGLTSQMRKASVSVPANIVEGSARKNRKEYLQFLYIAISSLAELSYYIRFTKKLGYLDTNGYEELWVKSEESLRTLQGLITYIEKSEVQCLMSSV
ncbi:four helix bundle protein [Dehalococcoidia bacterium]|nr:four helix bundle protein [Dehalococcoidia bacterium]